MVATTRPKNTRVAPQRKLPLGNAATSPNRDPDSVPAQLEALALGDSYSRSARIPLDDFAQSAAKEWQDKTTRVLSVAVSRTKEANPTREFAIERLDGLAHTTPNILASVIVTRTK